MKSLIVVVILFHWLFNIWAAEEVPTGSKYFKLANGLQVFLEERDKIPLVNIGFAVHMGSRNETRETNGLVHLLEHLLLLGGTDTYPAKELMEKIRGNGLYFNAHTGHDIMTLDISAPSEHTDKALAILKEKVFNLKLAAEEVEKEKKVILEELSQIEDDPEKLGMKLLLQALFSGHPYEKPVSGDKTIIEAATASQLEAFYKKYFVPSNCAIALVGDFKIETMEKRITEIFAPFENPPGSMPEFTTVSPLKKNIEITRELDITQAHMFFGFLAPGANHEDKTTMDVLTQILGKGVQPLLYRGMSGGVRRLVETMSMSYLPLQYGGAVLIHMVVTPRNVNPAQKKLIKFLKATRNIKYSKDDYLPSERLNITDYLETAKIWMRYAYQEYRERGLNLALSYARYMLVNNNPDGKSYSERLDAVTSSLLGKAAADYFSGEKYALITIVPQKKKSANQP